MPNKKTIAVIFGGRSAEHDVSIITAHIPIITALVGSGQYDVWSIYIGKDGAWYCDQAMNDLAFFREPDYEAKLKAKGSVRLDVNDGFSVVWPGFRQRTLKFDLVFPSMHGTYGEDGSLMGILRMSGVPFVGCDMGASAVSMDKVYTKQILHSQGLPIVPFMWFTKDEWQKNKEAILQKIKPLHRPLFVKPVHLGSSIGISKVKDDATLGDAIEVALHYDDKVLVEEGVEHLIELTLPIMGNETLTLASVEHPLNKTELFDFNDKYLSGGKGGKSGGVNNNYSEIPAKIAPEMMARVQDLARQTYKTLGCTGISRVDFLLNGATNEIFVNEVNNLPGSLYEHNWRQSGVASMELVLKLVALAEERFVRQKQITHTFNSEVLKQVGGSKVQP